MIAFCLYAQFLLVSPFGDYDSKILYILEQVEAGLNPFPLILAETIIGLDNFPKTKRFSGSPLLLEAWLYEKLRLLEPPKDIVCYKAKHYRTRKLHPMPKDVRNWLSTFPDTKVQWMCPWWRLRHVTTQSYTQCVPIAGLYSATFYNPMRLCRQYGQKQLIVGPMHEFEPGPLSQNFLDNLIATWPHRTIQRYIEYDEDRSTDDQYKQWIQLQQRENDEFIKNKRTRELQASSAHDAQRKKIKNSQCP